MIWLDSEGQGNLHAAVHGVTKNQTRLSNRTVTTESEEGDYKLPSLIFARFAIHHFSPMW